MKAYVKDGKVYLVFVEEWWRVDEVYDMLDSFKHGEMRVCSFGNADNAIEIQIEKEK